MSNETTTFILDYAEVHHDFSLGDLFAYLQEKTGIKKSSLSWYLFKLVNENVLVRTGRGTYAKVMKQVFSPPTDRGSEGGLRFVAIGFSVCEILCLSRGTS